MNKIAGGFADIYKNNVFVDVVSDHYVPDNQKIEFSVWHTFAGKKTLSDVQLLNAAGLDGFDGGEFGIREPKFLRVFQNQKKQPTGVRATVTGGSVAESFSDFEVMKLVDNRIDWSVSPSIRVQYMTEVIEAFDGTEQRIALRDKPRITAEFQYSLFDTDRYIFDNEIISQRGRVLIPLWPMQAKCVASSEGITLENGNEFLSSCEFMLITSGVESEIVSIEARQGLAFSCILLVLKNSSEELTAIPVFPASLSNENTSKIASNFYETRTLSLDIDPESVDFYAPDETKFTHIYDRVEWDEDLQRYIRGNKKPVLTIRYDRSADITANYALLKASFDPGFGLKHDHERAPGAYRTFNFEYKFFSEEDRQQFVDFAKITKGAQREFYCEAPYFGYEVISASGKSIVIKDSKLTLNTGTSAPAITLSLYNGTRLYRKIDSVTNNNDGTQTLNLLEDIQALTSEDIDYAAPLFLSRFESDDFNFIFETDQISTITKTIKQLIHAEHTRY
ncbi:hypothetical protein [Ectopseudomonas oleovorans]|uniref:hypothetical protein n=1 Tax=Ectopseudomonas oleovorans TaxID=301 RepID=UPI0035AFE0EB